MAQLGAPFQFPIPEILAQIFLEALPHDIDVVPDSPVSRVNEVPLVLGRVNAHWRQVAHNTPMLWTRLELEINCNLVYDDIADDEARNVVKTGVYMERSRNLPVLIVLRCLARGVMRSDIRLNLLREELFKHAGRWRSLKLEVLLPNVIRSFLDVVQVEAPLLETLQINMQHLKTADMSLGGIQQIPINLSFPVNLDRNSHLSHIALGNSIFLLQLPSVPLSNLQTLSLSGYLDTIIIWIQHCPVLEQLVITDIRLRNNTFAVGGLIYPDIRTDFELPHLKSLYIICTDLGFIYRPGHFLLHHLRTPNLPSLHLCINTNLYNIERAGNTPMLHDFLQKSSLPLENLIIMDTSIAVKDLITTLPLLPSLCSLELPMGLCRDSVIEALLYPKSSTSATIPLTAKICPSLCHLDLNVFYGISEALLANMISTRCMAHSSWGDQDNLPVLNPTSDRWLEQVSIKYYGDNPFQTLSENTLILDCLSKGFKLDISCSAYAVVGPDV